MHRPIAVVRLHLLLLTLMVLLDKMEVGKRPMVQAVDISGFSALFVFGDSLLDPGNGIHLDAAVNSKLLLFLSNANHPPYGRDLPSHRPTGRYSNGLVVTDILATFLGLPYQFPYFVGKGNILKGTSFAVAGAVINNQTGFYPFSRRNFYDQVDQFAEARQQLVSTLGENNANIHISKSLFLTWMGANDFFLNYNENPLGKTTAQKKYNPYEFRRILISSYKGYLQKMYDLGARKFAIMSLPPIGCSPIVQLLYHRKNETCISFINKEAQDFNADLLEMSKQLQAAYPNGHFTFLNTYDVSLHIITNPSAYGFLDGLRPCCSTGPFGGVPVCSQRTSTVCQDASKYVFWDFAHPTKTIDLFMVKRFMTGSSPDVQPFNIQDLSKL